MKAKVWVEFEKEIEVDVTISDMMAAISELIPTDQPEFVLNAISTALRVLQGIPQPLLDAIEDKPRGLILQYLRAEIARYERAETQEPT